MRAAIASQGVGLLGDIGRQIREIAGRFDDAPRAGRAADASASRGPSRPATSASSPAALAFLFDAAILNGIFLAPRPLAVSALFGSDGVSTAGIVLGAGAWIIVGSAYLLTFWSLAGQTPGMRVLSIRIEADGSRAARASHVARRRLGRHRSWR